MYFESINLEASEPLRPVGHQKLLDEVLGHRVHVARPVDLAREDLLVDPERVVVEEWWKP